MPFTSPKAIYVELDGQIYRICAGKIQYVEDLSRINEEAWVVTDFEDAVAQTLTLDVSKRYAPLVARKELQKSGQLDGPVQIITHWLGKKGKNSSEIYLTAIRLDLYHQYLELLKNLEFPVLLFPLDAVLYSVLKAKAGREPIAVIFQHGRMADLLVGTKNRVFYATRVVAFDETQDQLASLWQTVINEIKVVEQEKRIRVHRVLTLTWVTTYLPEDIHPEGIEFYSLPESEFIFEESQVKVSLPLAIRKTSGLKAVSGPSEKVNYFSRKLLPVVGITVAAMAGAMFLGHFYLSAKNSGIRELIRQNNTQLAEQRRAIAQIERIEYQDSLSFVGLLNRCVRSPSFKDLVNLISFILPNKAEVQKLDAKYHEWGLEVEVYVKTTMPFDEAHKVYQKFLKGMARAGYVAEQSSFNTSIQESEFMARLKKVI